MSKKISLFVLMLLLVMILASCQTQGQSVLYISPMESAIENQPEHSFHVTIPEGGSLTVYVEQWKEGERIQQESLFSCSDGEETIEIQISSAESRLKYVLQSSSGATCIEVDAPTPGIYLWDWLTLEEQEKMYSEDNSLETILFVLGTGNVEEGIPPVFCSLPILDPSFFTHYQEVQIIRAVFKR